MNNREENESVSVFEDPRRRDDFEPRHFPCLNGQHARELNIAEKHDRIKLEFLAAYYELNRAQARLLETRSSANSHQGREAEKKCLQAIEGLLVRRDQLEDLHAPLGVIAEPVVEDGFTKDLMITFGNLDAEQRRPEWHPFTAFVPIAVPDGIDLENLPMQIERPDINAQ